ncbi:MAG TPA: phosphoribosyltransferase family protein [Planctomycetota bacterium]|nr:phosphoribosyltransferase family protein [Planctomycetota bacterium]
MEPFADRSQAGLLLAERLDAWKGHRDVIALGLPRGGVPVAAAIARRLVCALDVFPVRKLGVPGHEELAMGAIASRGVRVLNTDVIAAHGVAADAIEAVATRELRRIEQQEALYRGGAPVAELTDRVVIVVDDGVATGATMAAAVEAVRLHGAAHVIAAAPVGAREAHARLERVADAVVFVREPEPFHAVGAWYRDFSAVSDEEVRECLRAHGFEAERTPRYRPQPV